MYDCDHIIQAQLSDQSLTLYTSVTSNQCLCPIRSIKLYKHPTKSIKPKAFNDIHPNYSAQVLHYTRFLITKQESIISHKFQPSQDVHTSKSNQPTSIKLQTFTSILFYKQSTKSIQVASN